MMSSQAKHWEKHRLLGNGDGGRWFGGRWSGGRCAAVAQPFAAQHPLLAREHRAGLTPFTPGCCCSTRAPFVLAASATRPAPHVERDGHTARCPRGPSKAACRPARSSLSTSHRSAGRLINFLFVFQSFIFKLQSSLLSNKYSTIKAFFSLTCDSNISVSHPPVTFPAINRFVKTAFDAPAAISHLKSHNYHPIMGLLTSSKNKAIEYGNLFVN